MKNFQELFFWISSKFDCLSFCQFWDLVEKFFVVIRLETDTRKWSKKLKASISFHLPNSTLLFIRLYKIFKEKSLLIKNFICLNAFVENREWRTRTPSINVYHPYIKFYVLIPYNFWNLAGTKLVKKKKYLFKLSPIFYMSHRK